MRGTTKKLLAAAALATAVVTATGGTGAADPTSLPAARDIVGVGDGVTQLVMNQLSADYNATIPSTDTTTPRLYSWDATGTSPITTKTGATSIARPNGADAGIQALKNNTSTVVDFARSSRGPALTDPNTFDFVAFASDAVSWAAKSGGNAPANLTTQNLKDIYTCNVTTWEQIDPSLPSTTIKPFLPQPGSALRTNFLWKIGVSAFGLCVTEGVQENEGSDAQLNDPDALVPYSVGHYVGQMYYGRGSGSDVQGPLTIRNVNGDAPVDTAKKAINKNFVGGSYVLSLYHVLRRSDWNAADAHGAALRSVFGADGWICTNPTALADITGFGFLPLPPHACGSITHS
ncbi:substrate-binding domain-containing protein [Kitasatospora sp. NPDC056731]|uniref:substrate-binding domain-containing protein n=1 Tax=Kitasatospora sp. NPDC056731 TaxID=3155422 RepID=UPI00342A6320